MLSSIVEILNHSKRESDDTILRVSFILGSIILVFVILEYLYVLMISVKGESPQQIDDMASIKSSNSIKTT